VTVRYLGGDAPAGGGQPDLLPISMLDQSEKCEPLNGSRNGGQSRSKFGGNIGYPDAGACPFQTVNNFDVILLCGREHWSLLILG
jgi:hypothetical protein